MSDPSVAEAEVADVDFSPPIVVELGNLNAQNNNDGARTPTEHPVVARIIIPQGNDRYGNPLYSMPDEHDDELFPAEIANPLRGVSEENKASLRKLLVQAQYGHPSGVKGLPNHAAVSVVAHPGGFWNAVSAPGSVPSFVKSNHPAMEKLLSELFECPAGYPANLEDTYETRYSSGVYPPGAHPDADVVMGHTTYGRLNQALVMGGWSTLNTTLQGTTGTATASSTTSLTGSAETGSVTHASNDAAGQWVVAGPNSSGTGASVYGLCLSNTSGTTPVYTVDQWYAPNAPGGAAGTTPNATAKYLVLPGGPPGIFVALTTDTTAFSLGGTGGTQDAATISQTLTSEFTTANSGLLRKIAPIGQSGATWTATPVFTATSTDNGIGAQTVGKAALTPSLIAGGKALLYMTLVSPTATLTATGDQLTLTWTFTMT
jgi:hypothetical protein